ncbi:MAG: hypothetical protein WCF84_08605 [Anaerolineae bacterium]
MTIFDLFGTYMFSGVPSNAVYDLIKAAWQKATHKPWEDLYLDSFQAAADEMRPVLARYSDQGKVSIDREQLSRALRQDLNIIVSDLTPSDIRSEEFIRRLTKAMESRSVLLISGHNLSSDDYAQLIRNLVRQSKTHFKSAIQKDEPAFRKAILGEAANNLALAREVSSYLKDQFGLVLENINAQRVQGVFVSLDEFKARMHRRSRHLPFSEKLVGREADFANAISLVGTGARILVIDGDPGIGKTHFSIELAEKLRVSDTFADAEIRCVKEAPSSLWEAVQSELQGGKRYILIADDANRIDHLTDIKRVFTDSRWPEGSVLIANTRSYNRGAVLKELREPNFSGVQTLALKRLSNADIDSFLQAKPFELDRELRKQIVTIAKGNPRMAVVAAEALKRGEKISEGSIPTLSKSYFESVFDELSDFLDNTPQSRTLLATIAALRFIDLTENDFMQELASHIGYSHVRQLQAGISQLQETEILDVIPNNRVARIFDDNISEYLVFRYFFDDEISHLDFEKDVLQPFGSYFTKRILENLVALRQKGYGSRKLTRLVSQLPRVAGNVLSRDTEDAAKLAVLQQMQTYAIGAPSECFKVIEAYARRRPIMSMPEDQALVIVT